MTSSPRDIAVELRAKLEAHHARLLDLCFDPETGEPRDAEMAEQILRIVETLARLDRKTLLRVKLLPDPSDTTATRREGLRSLVEEGEALGIMRGIADAAGHGFLVADLRAHVFYANRALTRMLGLAGPEDLEGRSLRPFYSDAVGRRFEKEIIRAVTERGQWVGEMDMLSRPGESIPTIHRLFLIHGASGRESGIGGMVIDLRERKRTRTALSDTEKNFRALAESANDGILIATGTGTHAYVNPRMAEITGYTAEELTTTIGLRELAHPEELERLLRNFQRRMEGNEGPRCYPTRIVRKDGRVVHVEVTGARTIWQGRPADTVIMRDVSRRREIEQALRESEERYSILVEQSRDGVAIFQEDVIAFISRPGAAMLGYTPDAMLGRPYVDFVVTDDQARVAATLQGFQAGNEALGHGFSLLRHRDGSSRLYEGHLVNIQYRGRPAVLAVLRHPFPGMAGHPDGAGQGA
jgi:PAS domain S-box-containing protein